MLPKTMRFEELGMKYAVLGTKIIRIINVPYNF